MYYWIICFSLALALYVLAFVLFIARLKSNFNSQKLSPLLVLTILVAASAIVLFYPVYHDFFNQNEYSANGIAWLQAVFLAFHNTIRLFVVDSDFEMITEFISNSTIDTWLKSAYSILSGCIYLTAPVLTFGFIMTFVKGIYSKVKYLKSYKSDIYIFSTLNEKSLCLAEDFKKNDNKRQIIFCNYDEEDDDIDDDLIERVKKLKAITFKKDVTVESFNKHDKNKNINFFVIDDDETEGVKTAVSLIQKYNHRENTYLYVLSTSICGELQLSTIEKDKMVVRRINPNQSLVYSMLYNDGGEIFSSAVDNGTENKQISIAILGYGQMGKELLRALTWFGQMDGYDLKIDVFDSKTNVESSIRAEFPDLLNEKYNNHFESMGEARYNITIHEGIDISSQEFVDEYNKIEHPTCVLVVLGDDDINIKTAINMRILSIRRGALEGKDINPVIKAMVFDSTKKQILSGELSEESSTNGIKDYSGGNFNIGFFGALIDRYSEDAILRQKIDEDALKRHQKWVDRTSCDSEEAFMRELKKAECQFWDYEYYYRSSVASVIHLKFKQELNLPGIHKKIEERTDEEKNILRRLEHRRWNAYMRTEGYIFTPKRNKLGRTHHNLVDFKDLSLSDQEKDDD